MHSIGKSIKDFGVEVKLGNIPGYAIENKFGANHTVPNNEWAILSSTSMSGMFPSSGTPVRIKAGGNAADTYNGVGARSITVVGLDITAKEVTETIITSGALSSLPTSTQFFRLYRAYVEEVGVYAGANIANIVIEKADGTDDMLTIEADEGQTQHGGYTIGAGKTGLLRSLHIYAHGTKHADIRVFIRENYTDVTAPFASKKLKLYMPGSTSHIPYKPKAPDIILNSFTDIWVESRGDGNIIDVSVCFEILIVDTPTGPIKQA